MNDYGEFQELISNLIGSEDAMHSQGVATGLSGTFGQTIDPSKVGALTPAMLRAANLQTYQPIAELRQQSMLGQLSQALEGGKMKQAQGGFAGSGAVQQQTQAARDVYGKSAADVMKEISGLQQQGRRGVLDVINSWRNLGAAITGSSGS